VDRYSYLVDFVLVGAVVGALFSWAGINRRRQVSLGVLSLALVLAGGLAARRQATIWRDTRTLFTHMERHPDFADNPRQHCRGVLLARARSCAGAGAV
jgi:hypothetical protein